MAQLTPLLLCLLFASSDALDTIFAKGGTCLYKIRDQWTECMETQNARIAEGKLKADPIYTNAALVDTVNRIACCAYWEFQDCVYAAAREHCPGEKRDMRAYVRQLGSAVPLEECRENYPRGSALCEEFNAKLTSGSAKNALSSVLLLVAAAGAFALTTGRGV